MPLTPSRTYEPEIDSGDFMDEVIAAFQALHAGETAVLLFHLEVLRVTWGPGRLTEADLARMRAKFSAAADAAKR